MGRPGEGRDHDAAADVAHEARRRGGGQRLARRRTTDFEWQTRVVMRRMTGIFQRSESSNAARVKS